MMFKIPRRIQLMCRPIDVVFETDLQYKSDVRGEARFRRNQIVIQAETDDVKIPHDHQVETFFHEVLHWIFELIERDDLGDDEKLIEMAGKLLAQAVLSAEE